MSGDFSIGVSVRPDHEGTIDDFPLPVYDALSSMAEDAIDMDRLGADTTEESWPLIGTMTLSRVDDETVNITIEWIHSSLW